MAAGPDVGPIAWVGGQFVPLAEARVSVLDRGFLFADGIYEVLPAYQGRPFALREHLARLARSLRELSISDPHGATEWRELIDRLIRENTPAGRPASDLIVYLQVTRGAAPLRAHAFPENTPPTVVGWCTPLALPGEAALRDGVGAVTRPDIRWGRCDIKTIALLPNVLAVQSAREQNAHEAILHRDGRITEGGSSNVFAVLGTSVVTPSKGPDILPGVTRDVLIDLLRANRIPIQERRLTLTELRSAEEIWITSSAREVLPVTKLDGEPVGSRKPGPLWKEAYALFQAAKQDPQRYPGK